MRLTREEMRAQIEEALRTLAPGPYERLVENEKLPDDDIESGFFLALRGPKGTDLEYYCDEDEVRVEFGPAGGGVSEYNTSDEEGRDNFTEADLKEILKGVIQETLDIRAEKVFAAYYKKFLIGGVGGLYPAAEFEALKKKKAFEAKSWNGTFNRP